MGVAPSLFVEDKPFNGSQERYSFILFLFPAVPVFGVFARRLPVLEIEQIAKLSKRSTELCSQMVVLLRTLNNSNQLYAKTEHLVLKQLRGS